MNNDLNLLEKTELWVSPMTLEQANLTDMAAAVASVLGLEPEKVMVVDVRPDHVTFDLVVHEIAQESIMGKEKALLEALAAVPGVHLTEESHVSSNGILGLICSEEDPHEVTETVRAMRDEIVENISHRAIVFPTGFELEQGLIEDTNTPYLKELLEQAGYQVKVGEIIPDDLYRMTDILSEALDRGYGLIVTTGGVGAEDRDVRRVWPFVARTYRVGRARGGAHAPEMAQTQKRTAHP